MRGPSGHAVTIDILVVAGIVGADSRCDFAQDASRLLRVHAGPLHLHKPWLLVDDAIITLSFGQSVQSFTIDQRIGCCPPGPSRRKAEQMQLYLEEMSRTYDDIMVFYGEDSTDDNARRDFFAKLAIFVTEWKVSFSYWSLVNPQRRY